MENVVNKVMLSGFAGNDAEIRVISDTQKVARVNLAVHETYRNSGSEDASKTQWFTLIFWNAKADIAEEKIKKGVWFAVEGRLQTNNYDAKDGTKRYTTEVVVNEVEFTRHEKAKP